MYAGVVADIRSRGDGAAPDADAFDYPRVQDGARGVRFIERTVDSAESDVKWTAW